MKSRILFLSLLAPLSLHAEILPIPTITSASTAFGGSFLSANAFDNKLAEYASAGAGAGTFMLMNFTPAVTADRMIMVARNNAVDVINALQLTPNFGQANATNLNLGSIGSNAAGFIKSFAPVTFSDIRWQATSVSGLNTNIGCTELRFLKTPAGQQIISATAIASSSEFSADYSRAKAVDGNAGAGAGKEFASAGNGTGTFIDFDLGADHLIHSFDFFDRLPLVDRTSAFNILLSNSTNFTSPITTLSYTPGETQWGFTGNLTTPTVARYVRFQVTAKTAAIGSSNNQGMSEIIFYGKPLEAGSLVVTSTADVVDATDLQTTLREAIAHAAGQSDTQTITFSNNTNNGAVNFHDGTQRSIRLLGSSLLVESADNITGPGANRLTISGNNASRVFTFNSGLDNTISGLSISNGIASGISKSGGNLTLNDCTISQNSSAANASAGGINASSGSLTLNRCTLSTNFAETQGGGISATFCTVVLTDCTLHENFANSSTTGGGGIFMNGGSLALNRCTISSNSAGNASGNSASGGGIAFIGTGTGTITNCTISGNSATGSGGGIAVNTGRNLTLTHCTITGNTAASTTPANRIGGIRVDGSTAILTMAHNIIANSTGVDIGLSNNPAVNITGPNLVEDGSLLNTTSGDPNLGPLANNGGPTQTHALLSNSPAIDAGNSSIANLPMTDQRGFARRFFAPDLGAYEAKYPITVTTSADSGAGSLREALGFANAHPDADNITFSPALAGRTITLTSIGDNIFGPTAFPVSGEISIDGGTGGVTISQNNTASPTGGMRLFHVANTGNLTLRNLTLSGGLAQGGSGLPSGGGGAGLGGAIINRGTLQLTQTTLAFNMAKGGNGGGIGAAGLGGGGLFASAPNGSTSTVTPVFGFGGAPTTFPILPGGFGGFGGGGGGGTPDPNPGPGGNGGFGGGGGGGRGVIILPEPNVFPPGPGGNGGAGGGNGSSGATGTSGAGGGGAGMGGAVFNYGGTVIARNSTFSNNTAQGGTGANDGSGLGGAVFNLNGTVNFLHVTASNNTVRGNVSLSATSQNGGALYSLGLSNIATQDGPPLTGSAATAVINNSILTTSIGSNNAVTIFLTHDFDQASGGTGTVSSSGTNNIVSSTSVAGFTNNGDPLLAPLANNGGPTQTHALLLGSPAINTGNNSNATGLATDQRGGSFARRVNGIVDIGAFEFVLPSPLVDWRTLHGLDIAGTQDLENPSGDGVSNILKYAFNLAPNAGNLAQSNVAILPLDGNAGLPHISRNASDQLVIVYLRRKSSSNPGITYTPQTGETLSDFAAFTSDPVETTVPIDATWERVTVTDPVITPKRFGRLRVTKN